MPPDPADNLINTILAATPVFRDGSVLTGWRMTDGVGAAMYGDPRPVAARQAAAFARWLADHCPPVRTDDIHVWTARDLRELADQLDTQNGG